MPGLCCLTSPALFGKKVSWFLLFTPRNCSSFRSGVSKLNSSLDARGSGKSASGRFTKKQPREGSFSYIRVEERFKEDKERVRREIQKTLLAHVSACPLDEMGLPTLDSKRPVRRRTGLRRPFRRMGNVAPFHRTAHATGIVLDPLVPLSKAEEEVQVFLDHVEKSAADLLPSATIDAAVIGREATLVYYPVMSLRFSCSGGQGAALFVPTTADLIALSVPGRPPPTPERRLVGLCGLAAGVIAGSLMRLALLPPPWMSSPLKRTATKVRLLVLGLAIAGAAWWVLRHIVHTVDGRPPRERPPVSPLQCLSCSGDLTGRAIDRLAFCLSCQKTFLCDDPGLSEIHSIHTTLLLRGKAACCPFPSGCGEGSPSRPS